MKVVKTAVQVIGAIATVAAFIPGPHQAIAATIAKVATVVSVGLEIAARKAASAKGSPVEYRLDPQAGIPYIIGRTFFAGNCVKRETWGADNKYQGFTTVYSYGPIHAIDQFTADRAPINFDANGNAIGQLKDFMWFRGQLGLCPEPAALPSPVAGYPGWGASSKLSGLAASNWVLAFDKKGKKYTNGPPAPGIIASGVKVYDPRLDSTYPGGVGACRALDETTYVYSERPHLHALTWALGRYQNGKRRMGIGFKPSQIDIPYFVAAANVDEANGWKIGGVIYSTDDKWNVLKQMMEGGAGEPFPLGGKLSGLQSSPKVSLHTITGDQLVGRASAVGTQSQRDRINGGVPRYRSEAHGWQIIPATTVRVPAYVTLDGGERTKEYDWSLIQQLKQATELTGYAIVNAREIGPIELNLKLRWVGLKPGDCATINIPEININNMKAVVIGRTLDPATGAVTLQFKSETDSKHPFALGQTGEAPPTPTLTGAIEPPPPPPAEWTLTPVALSSPLGSLPALRFSGTVSNTAADTVALEYRKAGDATWSTAAQILIDGTMITYDVTDVIPGQQYEGSVRYVVRGLISDERLLLGPVAVGVIMAGDFVGSGDLAFVDNISFGTPQLTVTPGGVTATLPAFQNASVSLSAGGQLLGAGGGAVTIGGIAPNIDPSATLGDNFIPNGFLVDGTAGFTGISNVTRVAASSVDPIPFFFERASGAASGGASTPYRPAPASAAIWLSLWVYASAAGQQTDITLQWYAGNGAPLTAANQYFVAPSAGWFFRNIAITKPDNASYYVCSFTSYAQATIGVGRFGGIRLSGTAPGATVGAVWNSNLTGTPTNLAALTGSEGVNNAALSLSAGGQLLGGGGGAVTPTGLGLENGADVTKVVTGPASSTVTAKSDGAFEAGVLPKLVNFQLRRANGTNATALATWAVTPRSGGATASISVVGGAGSESAQLSVSALPATSEFEITATISGVLVGRFYHRMEKVVPPQATATGGSGGSAPISVTVPNATMIAATPVIQATAGPTGNVSCVAPVEYTLSGPTAGSVTAYGVWRWRPVGGVFADITTEVGPGLPTVRPTSTEPIEPGYLDVNMTKGGLTVGAIYEFQLFLRSNNASRGFYASGQGGTNATATGQ